MPTPIYRQQQSTTLWLAAASMPASTLTNNSITGSSVQRLKSVADYSGALLLDLWLSGSFGTDPAGVGALQAIIVARSPDGVQGPTPIAATARNVYTFAQGPQSTSGKVYSIERIPAPLDFDIWLYNNATGQTFTYTNTMNSSSAAFGAILWTQGT